MNRRGFTIAELLISVTILGVLSGLAVINFSAQSRNVREDQLRLSLRSVRTAVRAFQQDTQFYPASLSDLARKTAPTTAMKSNGTLGAGYDSRYWRGPYLSAVPLDPMTGGAFQYVPGDNGYVRSAAPGNDSRGVAFSSY